MFTRTIRTNKKWANKTSYIDDFHSNENFSHNHDNFYMKNRCNSYNNNSYNSNFYCINNFPDNNNNNDDMNNSNNKWSNETIYDRDFNRNKNFYHKHDNFYMKIRCNSINNNSYVCYFYCINNFPDKNNNYDYINNNNNKCFNKTSYNEDIHSNKDFYHNHDTFYMKKKFNSNKKNNYICNYYCINNFRD